MAIDRTKPVMASGQTVGQVVDAARANQNDIDDRLVVLEALGLSARVAELVAARGSKADLGTRLSVALDDAGNWRLPLLTTLPVAQLGDVPTYLTTSTFRVPGNRVAAYPAACLLRLTAGAVDTWAVIQSSAYDAGNSWTVITTASAVVPAGLSAVALSPLSINLYGDVGRDFTARALSVVAGLTRGGLAFLLEDAAPAPAAPRVHDARTLTGAATLVPQDIGRAVLSAGYAITLPGASDEGVGPGWYLDVRNTHASTAVAVSALAGETVDGGASINIAAGATKRIVRSGTSAFTSLF